MAAGLVTRWEIIAYRSEEGEGGLFVIPALGGAGLERRIASFGNHPRWSPDSSQVLFQTTHFTNLNRINVVGLDGGAPREIAGEFMVRHPYTLSVAWHPDSKRATSGPGMKDQALVFGPSQFREALL